MSTKSIVSIGGLTVKKQPTDFGIEMYNLTKSGRVASGKMTMDIIAQKHKFTISYDVISGSDMDTLLSVVFSPTVAFFEFVYMYNGVQKSCTVYAGAPKAKKFRTGSEWYWKDFSVDLIEQ